jgi:tetratricopeptide (TPR) repeat protein
MPELRGLRLFLSLALLGSSLPAPTLAQPAPAAPSASASTDYAAPLEEARMLVKSGDYDRAIEILKPVVERSRNRLAEQRDAYLLLIKTHVFLGNDLKFRTQGKVSSDLNYEEARKRIAECLRIRELRHTRPEPASEYPPEMISLFAEIRARIFGAFRVDRLQPREALVLLDGDTLRAAPGDTLLGDVDIATGPHLVVVHARGYRDLSEEITIPPGSTLERSYQLSRRHGRAWYASWITGALGVGVIAALAGTSGTSAPQPLPVAPDPPTDR